MATLSLHSTVTRHDEVVAAPLGDDLMMMSLSRGAYYSLNPVGAAVWQHIERPITVAALCAALLHEFEVSPAQCEAEVLTLLSEMEREGLVRVKG